MTSLRHILKEIKSCQICADKLDHAPRPVLQIGSAARILIAGQAPGAMVHKTGVPFNDPSGDRLRRWMGVSKEVFYDPQKIAILPMGFCYPGKGKSGDLPPRKECAPAWRTELLEYLPHIELTLIIGRYAMDYHLNLPAKTTLTEAVKSWESHGTGKFILPHPSPRNNIWLAKNPWFEEEILPPLQQRIQALCEG